MNLDRQMKTLAARHLNELNAVDLARMLNPEDETALVRLRDRLHARQIMQVDLAGKRIYLGELARLRALRKLGG